MDIMVITFCSIHLQQEELFETSLRSELARVVYSKNQIVSVVLLSISSVLGIFVFWLCGYHQYLMCRNETTNENLKGSYKKLGNPFYKGCFDNVQRLFRRDKRNWHPEDVITREPMQPLSGGTFKRKNSMPRMLRR